MQRCPCSRARPLWLLAGLLLLLAGCGGGSGGDSPEHGRVLRLTHGLDATHPVHIAMESMAGEIARETGNRIRVVIYPSEQIGSEREGLELLQLGALDITKVSSSVLESFSPEFRVFGVPYLFRDDAHRWAALEGPIGDGMLEKPEPYRLRGLCFYDAGSRSFYTTGRRVEKPADLTGLAIRVQESATAIAMVRTLGGAPTPISWGELYTALQQGVVDGAENNPPSFHLSRHYEVCKFYSLDEHTAVPDVLVISKRTWDSLTPADQAIVQRAADNSSKLQRELWGKATEEALRAVSEAGVEVIRVDKAQFAARLEPLYEGYLRDPVIGPLFQQIRDLP